MTYRPKQLLNLDQNAKTVKGQKKGYRTAILYLAPATLSGFEVCPMRSAGCTAACLNTAGHGQFNSVQMSRIAKTRWFFEDRSSFLAQLVKELEAFVTKTRAAGFTPVVRLNGTSDILWERVPVQWAGLTFDNVMGVFLDVQFYDYTKHNPAKRRDLPPNYALTFSLDERAESEGRAAHALMAGWNVAVVFRKALPDSFVVNASEYCSAQFRVVNGDETDLRFLDERGVIVGLKAKGRAKKDTSGFVRE